VRHERPRVLLVHPVRERVTGVAENCRMQRELALDPAGVGVEQKLGGIVPLARRRVVRAVHA